MFQIYMAKYGQFYTETYVSTVYGLFHCLQTLNIYTWTKNIFESVVVEWLRQQTSDCR